MSENERAEEAKKEMMKKMGIGIGLVAIVLGIIGLVVALQPSAEDTNAVITVDENTPTKGSSDAAVIVAEYSDFQCPACGAAYPIVKSLVEEYGDRIQFVYNHFPLPQHEYAFQAAVSAECALEQDQFFPYHDTLFERQNSWSQAADEQEAADAFRAYAEELGMDVDAYDSCIERDDIADRVTADMDDGDSIGVNSTPTFFVNGERVSLGDSSGTGLREAIDAELNE